MTELPVYADRMPGRKNKFALRCASDDVRDAYDGGIAIHNKEHVVVSDRCCRVNLVACRRVVVPYDFLVRGNLAHAELMREQDVSVRKHDGVADFAFPCRVVVGPHNLAVVDYEHAAVVRLPCAHKVVLRQPLARIVNRKTRRRVFMRLCKHTASNDA